MSEQDLIEKLDEVTNTPKESDNLLAILKRIDAMVELFDKTNEKNRKWLLYNYDITELQVINSIQHKRFIISYQGLQEFS